MHDRKFFYRVFTQSGSIVVFPLVGLGGSYDLWVQSVDSSRFIAAVRLLCARESFVNARISGRAVRGPTPAARTSGAGYVSDLGRGHANGCLAPGIHQTPASCHY